MPSPLPRLAALLCSLATLTACSATQPSSALPGARAPASTSAAAPRPPDPCGSATASLLADLRAPLRIEAFITRVRPPLDTSAIKLAEILDSYRKLAPERITVTVTHVKTDADITRAKNLGVDALEFYEDRGGKPVLAGHHGIAFSYGATASVIPQLETSAVPGLRYWLNRKVLELRLREERRTVRLGYVPGAVSLDAAELSPDAPQASVKSILARAFPFYSLEAIDLSAANPIDPALRGIIVLTPARPFTNAERRKIDDYLMLGGRKLAVFASPAVGLLQYPRPDPATHAVDELTAPYGIHVEPDVVLDPSAHLVLELPGEPPRAFEALAVPVADETRGSWVDSLHPAFFGVRSFALPYASTVTLKEPGDPTFRIRALARSSSAATSAALADFPPTGDIWTVQVPTKPAGVRLLAAVSSGNLPSAFQPPGDTACSRRASSPGAVLVVASSLLPGNAFLYGANRLPAERDTHLAAATAFAQGGHLTTSILVMKDTLDWLDTSPEGEECAYRED